VFSFSGVARVFYRRYSEVCRCQLRRALQAHVDDHQPGSCCV